MRTLFVAACVCLLLTLAACRQRAGEMPAACVACSPMALFNGRDLSGWVQVLDSKWVVENGALVARQDPAGRREGESWLITQEDFGDFVLTLRYRITPGGNSGVFLRDPVPRAARLAAAGGGKPPWEAGFEANINADDPNYPTGSLWEIAKAPHGLQEEGEWNDMKVKVQVDRVMVWVNGKLAVDTKQARSGRGAIGLQRHGGAQYRDKVVEFKEIMIQELK